MTTGQPDVAPPRPRRSRRTAKDAGRRFATNVARYLAVHLGDGVETRDKNGAKDRGDITGVRHLGQRVVLECKDVTRADLSGWLREAEVERGNDDAGVGIVVAKRRGKSDPGDALVAMTLRDLVSLLTGARP